MKIFWNKIPYWLRGGVIALVPPVLAALPLLVLYLCKYFGYVVDKNMYVVVFFLSGSVLSIPFRIFPESLVEGTLNYFGSLTATLPPVVSGSISIAVLLLSWFFAGVVIGFIIGKSKKDNNAKF